jgi:hypothetical protein
MNDTFDIIYDDNDVKCKMFEDEDIRPIEPHCLNCGYTDCECDDYEYAIWWCEVRNRWIGEEDEDED